MACHVPFDVIETRVEMAIAIDPIGRWIHLVNPSDPIPISMTPESTDAEPLALCP
jgi:hypothetical protein